jgi:hypothetical protein
MWCKQQEKSAVEIKGVRHRRRKLWRARYEIVKMAVRVKKNEMCKAVASPRVKELIRPEA